MCERLHPDGFSQNSRCRFNELRDAQLDCAYPSLLPAGGLRRYTHTGHCILELRLRAVLGNRHSERNEAQRVCNPLSGGPVEPFYRRVTAAETKNYRPEEREIRVRDVLPGQVRRSSSRILKAPEPTGEVLLLLPSEETTTKTGAYGASPSECTAGVTDKVRL